MQVKTYYTDSSMFSGDLCILPNDGESQYEAFQSIFATIMFSNTPPADPPESPYEQLCAKYGITLMSHTGRGAPAVAPGQTVIFFQPSETEETHYKAIRDGRIYDPYAFFQAKNTQGYCQMFAFFLAINDIAEFQQVNQTRRINIENFEKLVLNSQACLNKSLNILAENDDIKYTFMTYFDHLVQTKALRVEKGIKPGTDVDNYLHDFWLINQQIPFVASYIHDLPLVGWPQGVVKTELWNHFASGIELPNFSAEAPSNVYSPSGGKRSQRKKSRKTRKARKSRKARK